MSQTADRMIQTWVAEVRKDDPKFRKIAASNIVVSQPWGAKRAALFSYGTHFELARWVDSTDAHPGFWLLNGDNYSPTTTGHQNETRRACAATGELVLILPHVTMSTAGINFDSIVPVEITKDRYIPDVRTYTLENLPRYLLAYGEGAKRRPSSYHMEQGDLVDNGDGTFTRHGTRHVLGESVFRADYGTSRLSDSTPESAYFLSAFDHQETRQHYFLCQLPADARPATVEDAFTALRPTQVREADAAGVQVTRQGDVFAVPTTLTTREVRKLAGGAAVVKAARLLGLSHTATEAVVATDGRTFARGTLTHRPMRWGMPQPAEHKRQRMADGKTWHLIVKNTVPQDARGDNRAWSVVGTVD